MPKILESRVKALEGKVNNPWAVATSQLQKEGKLKRGTRELAAPAKRKAKKK